MPAIANLPSSTLSTEFITTEEEPPSPAPDLSVLISPHLRRLSQKSPAIRKQFFPSALETEVTDRALLDPLLEDSHSPTKGLVHKYPGRVLITLTMTCAAYCRFCTRRRSVSDFQRGLITPRDLTKIISYLNAHEDISEVIFSGGDPLTVQSLLIHALESISTIPHIKVIRIHSRVPVSNPVLVTPALYQAIKKVKRQPLYFSVHFEHPDEITKRAVAVINRLRRAGAILMSQSVFLKGVNDDANTLALLFSRLVQLGIRPYYIYHCDPVRGAEHFIVPFDKEVEIMTKLRCELSGLATPTFVIDTPSGAGKIPVPLDFWDFDHHHFKDFHQNSFSVID